MLRTRIAVIVANLLLFIHGAQPVERNTTEHFPSGTTMRLLLDPCPSVGPPSTEWQQWQYTDCMRKRGHVPAPPPKVPPPKTAISREPEQHREHLDLHLPHPNNWRHEPPADPRMVRETAERADRFHLSASDRSSEHQPRVTILLSGESSRPRCTNRDAQIRGVIPTQRREMVEPLVSKGFGVRILLATNDCGRGYGEELRAAYGTELVGLTLDNCKGAPNQRCLVNRAMRLWGTNGGGVRPGHRDLVLFSRPDMLFRRQGHELVNSMASYADRITWPFKCERDAWQGWQCAADTAVMIPAAAMKQYQDKCLGTLGCHPEARGDGKRLNFKNGGFACNMKNIKEGNHGHCCYRCVLNNMRDLHPGFALQVELRVNTRVVENPYYAFFGKR